MKAHRAAWRVPWLAIVLLVVGAGIALAVATMTGADSLSAFQEAAAGEAVGAGLARVAAPLFKSPVSSVELVLDFFVWATAGVGLLPRARGIVGQWAPWGSLGSPRRIGIGFGDRPMSGWYALT